MVAFRNVSTTPGAAVEEWGVEELLAAIDRGGLAEWRRIARAVADHPHGAVSAAVEQALELAEDAGAATALRAVLDRERSSDAERLGQDFRRWVAATGMTRAELAEHLGTSRSRLSTYETGKVVPSAVTAAKVRRLAQRRRVQLM